MKPCGWCGADAVCQVNGRTCCEAHMEQAFEASGIVHAKNLMRLLAERGKD